MHGYSRSNSANLQRSSVVQVEGVRWVANGGRVSRSRHYAAILRGVAATLLQCVDVESQIWLSSWRYAAGTNITQCKIVSTSPLPAPAPAGDIGAQHRADVRDGRAGHEYAIGL